MSWFNRLTQGLKKSSNKITEGISRVVTKRKLDDQTLEELEEALISADLGVETSMKLTAALAKGRFEKEVSDEEVRTALAEEAAKILGPVAKPLEPSSAHHPHVVLVVGVNGSGKTTTIGKLAQSWKEQGCSVRLTACDTFRAAAVEQLKVWGDRLDVPVETRPHGADAAGLAYDALQIAKSKGEDIVIIDTAGRLQNRADLMAELEKINRVIKKAAPEAPHDTVLVLDVTTGQNAHSQVDIFKKTVNITGLIITKLDGTAKGGVLVSLADKFGLPIHAIGVGEKAEDLRPFAPMDFARGLLGLG